MLLCILVLLPLVMAIPCAVLGRNNSALRDNLPLTVCLIELVLAGYSAFCYGSGTPLAIAFPRLGGLGLSFELDGFRAVWVTLIAFCWLCSEAFAREYLEEHQCRYHFFTLLTLCGTMGVFLSADLYTTFFFFETMSLASWAWVAHEQTDSANYAADTYLAIAVIGGLVTLMGLFLLSYLTGGDLTINGLYERCIPLFDTERPLLVTAAALLLLGFGAKAGMFPLHFWLPMAHPVAPAPASALLSGILTKCGMFGIIVVSCGIFYGHARWGEIVLGLGAITMLWGAILGVFSVDLKRTLACSSVSQIGFILTGVGMCGILGEENTLAAHGVMLHMMNHSLIKLTLFLLAGAVAMNRHTLDLNRLRGCCKGNKPLLFAFIMAWFSVAGVPLFSGYISKTLLHEAIVEGTELVRTAGQNYLPFQWIEWVFLFSGGLTLAYMGKLFYTLFVLPPADKAKAKPLAMRPASVAAIVLPACLMPLFGALPHLTMDRFAALGESFLHGTASEHVVAYFSLTNLSGACISLTIGVLVFFLFVRPYLMSRDSKGMLEHQNRWPAWLDLERRGLRPLVQVALPTVCGTIFRLLDYLPDTFLLLLRKTLLRDRMPTPRAASESEFLDRVGHQLDMIARKWGKREGKPSFAYLLGSKQRIFVLTTKLIVASLSFGLLLFCAGLTLTLVYLLV